MKRNSNKAIFFFAEKTLLNIAQNPADYAESQTL